MFGEFPPVYDYTIRKVDGAPVLCIVDLYDENRPSMTVTNGVELVLAEIARREGELPAAIIYRDTAGFYDRLRAKPDGRFLGFSPLRSNGEPIADERQAAAMATEKARKGAH